MPSLNQVTLDALIEFVRTISQKVISQRQCAIIFVTRAQLLVHFAI